jgi:hypothetical protein
VPNVPANLLLVTAAREIADANCSPAKLSHQGSKVPICAGCALALREFQDVHQRLRANALQAIDTCRPTHALQRADRWR